MLQRLKENYFIRSFLYKLLNGFDVSRKIKGMNYELRFNAGTNFNFFFSREIEIEQQAKKNLASLIKEDFLIFDIGAHIGYYTVIFSSICNQGHIVVFEPDRNNLKYLKNNIESNNLSNVVIIDKAASSKISESSFYEDVSTGRTSSLQPDAWHPNATEIKIENVQTTTLNEISIEYGIPDLIKCDVEGHEIEVLQGANEVLKAKPILFIEVAEKNRAVVTTLLNEFGYKIYNGEIDLEFQSQPLKEINCQNILCL